MITTSTAEQQYDAGRIPDHVAETKHTLTLVNDSVSTLGSADTYSRYAGAEFGAVWMDEPSHYGDELHDLTGMIRTRLRAVDGPKVELWTLTGAGYNSAWEILAQRQEADGDPIGLDVDVVRASVLDNPYLTDGDASPTLSVNRRAQEVRERVLHEKWEQIQTLRNQSAVESAGGELSEL